MTTAAASKADGAGRRSEPVAADADWQIVAASPADARDVASCIHELAAEIVAAKGDDPAIIDDRGVVDRARNDLANRDYAAFVARSAGAALGVITIGRVYRVDTGAAFGAIQECLVRQPWRGCGVGGALLRAAVGIARERGWTHLEVRCPLEPAFAGPRRFYRRAGFAPAGSVRLVRSL